MTGPADHLITTLDQLRERIGTPSPLVESKIFDRLEPVAIDFIRRSPFLIFGTVDAHGRPDLSPKGDDPGFVHVEDDRTLLVPERKGNKLAFGLRNLLAHPQVGLIFVIPGTDETLRINGTARITTDPAVCERLAARGEPAILAVRITVERCFFHCAKAFKRSKLWESATWPPARKFSFAKLVAPKLGWTKEEVAEVDRLVEEDYRKNL